MHGLKFSPEERAARAKGLYDKLTGALRGQDFAMKTMSHAVERVERAGLRPKNKPLGTFFSVGPTGVGKTESTILFADQMFGSPDEWQKGGNFARFDMAEYMEPSSIRRLIGTDGTGEQGELGKAIDALNARGGGVLLLDEIEKAAQGVKIMWLGLLDAARVTMANGDTKDGRNLYIVMTSNEGARKAARMRFSPPPMVRKTLMNHVERAFSPEFLARFTERIVFGRLERRFQVQIARDVFPSTAEQVRAKLDYASLTADNAALLRMAKLGYTETGGARYIKTAVQNSTATAILGFEDAIGRKTARPHIRLTTDDAGLSIVAFEVQRNLDLEPIPHDPSLETLLNSDDRAEPYIYMEPNPDTLQNIRRIIPDAEAEALGWNPTHDIIENTKESLA